MGTVVTRYLVKKTRTSINREQESSSSDMINASAVGATEWESSDMSLQLNVKSSY
jgi:hypothetical protein